MRIRLQELKAKLEIGWKWWKWWKRWECLDDAMEIFEACGYHPHIGIKVLIQKALITIVDTSYGVRFDMHDLIQEMGHYIVRGEHPNNPEKHSRVWKQEEINDMCLGDATMHLPRLKVLELVDMKNLLSTPEFDGLPCLQKLTLHCEELNKIHPSLGNHTSLEYVCVSGCSKLRMFPTINSKLLKSSFVMNVWSSPRSNQTWKAWKLCL
ncbi:hypothetical protein L1987_23010 [Smallanthus sonchifolius]|uniref:Uncharacterized protein n=1 Tax=Smallanthus sonchifolius TaxID=185202 RepID=A0ACB9IHC6_9ASTR|nr:hypothetical protein L1987_23010 [Smallanthus sonchifolius]